MPSASHGPVPTAAAAPCRRSRRVALSMLALAGAFTFAAAPAARADDDAEQPRTITVVGYGEVRASPDLALLELAVETTADTAARATTENARRTTAVIDALKKKIGSQDRVTTTGYSLQPRYASRRPGSDAPPEITGYVSSNQVRVETRGLDAVGELIDAAIAAGANRTDGLSFTLQNRSPHLRAALEKAGAEAQAQAQAIAAALQVKLGEVLSAATSGAPMPQPLYKTRMLAMAAEAVSTPVEPGEVEVSATLTVSYRIE
jgi:uncharacterized protein YggE